MLQYTDRQRKTRATLFFYIRAHSRQQYLHLRHQSDRFLEILEPHARLQGRALDGEEVKSTEKLLLPGSQPGEEGKGRCISGKPARDLDASWLLCAHLRRNRDDRSIPSVFLRCQPQLKQLSRNYPRCLRRIYKVGLGYGDDDWNLRFENDRHALLRLKCRAQKEGRRRPVRAK